MKVEIDRRVAREVNEDSLAPRSEARVPVEKFSGIEPGAENDVRQAVVRDVHQPVEKSPERSIVKQVGGDFAKVELVDLCEPKG